MCQCVCVIGRSVRWRRCSRRSTVSRQVASRGMSSVRTCSSSTPRHRTHTSAPDRSTPRTDRMLQLIHTATPDTTKLSCLCRVRFGGVNWISGNSRLNVWTRSEQSSNSHRHIRHDTNRTVLSCLVWWWCEFSRSDRRQVRSASECVNCQATAGRTPTQNALVGRSGRLNLHHLTRHRQHCLVVSGGRCELGIKPRHRRISSTNCVELSMALKLSTGQLCRRRIFSAQSPSHLISSFWRSHWKTRDYLNAVLFLHLQQFNLQLF